MENKRIHKTNKSKLSEFNLEEIRGWIVGKTYDIEIKIDLIICDFFRPEEKELFKKVMLNSSIISTGGKMKILRNMNSFDNKIIEKIGKFTSIRNAFAHLTIKEFVEIKINRDEKGNFRSSKVAKIISQIEVMNSSGELKTKNAHELITEFFELYKEINEYLLNLLSSNSNAHL